MSTNGPMTQEQLDAIQARADAIRARVDTITGSGLRCSYPWPDPTDERIKELEKENAELRKRLTVDDAMVERAVKAHRETFNAWPVKRNLEDAENRRVAAMRAALNAALNPGEGS